MKIIYGVVEENGIKKRTYIVLENRKCEQCSIEFEPKKQTSKYCSRKCSKHAENEKNKEDYIRRSKEYYAENLPKCRQQRKEYYWKNPEIFRLKAKEYREKNYDEVRARDLKYKDKVRHGNKRQELVQANGLQCSKCGIAGTSFDISAHHVTFNSTEHETQELLCRRCHQRVHRLGNDTKPVSREDIINAIQNSTNLEDAAKSLGIARKTLLRKRKKYNLF